ncbi:MAG: DUF2157 domain-containing protein [Chitinophagaceae bacterium]
MNRQLLRDIPELMKADVISEDTALRIISYYKEQNKTSPNILTVVLAVLGALLVGSGILLVIAHNWDELSRPVKTGLSFFPLLAAQLACAYTLFKRKDNRGWRESSGILLFFAVGASITLISQIYQVSGSISGFLLTWVLLGLPMVYILSASTVALLCLAAITWYASIVGYSGSPGEIPFMYAIVILFLIPHYFHLFKKDSGSRVLHIYHWSAAVSVANILGSFSNNAGSWFEWVFLLYCILFTIYYRIGLTDYFLNKRLIKNPFLLIGLSGIIVILLIWSFRFLWIERKTPISLKLFNDPLPYLILTGVTVLLLISWRYRRQQVNRMSEPATYSFAVLLLLFAGFHNFPSIALLIVNAWIFFIALYFIRKGSRQDHFGILNVGLVILASLTVCRFFDDTIPFIWRGILFVAAGAGFFLTNYLMLRKRKLLIKTE